MSPCTPQSPSQFAHLPSRLLAKTRNHISLAEGLRGYDAVPQVGVRGYRIDIGVRHPDLPGRFILGVECDGATYHSAKATRDRDRLRQTVLERLGWQVHRVWPTDWFRDPHAEFETLLRRIDSLRGVSQVAE